MKVLAEKIGSRDVIHTAHMSTISTAERASAVNDHYSAQLERVLTFEFSRDRKLMSVLARPKTFPTSTSGFLFVKGAPEAVLERCTSAMVGTSSPAVPMTPELRAELLQSTLAYGKEGLRTLALAYVDVSSTDPDQYHSSSTADYARFEHDFTFVSLVGMRDPPRPEVRAAVEKCRAAGIRVVCITGDNKSTAETICRHIGIFGEDEDLTGKSYTGREFDALTHEEKLEAVQRASLFTRTEPTHKSQLVDLMQSLGLVTAMTGGMFPSLRTLISHNPDVSSIDGVNDAPALKKADIGIAMGSGTDVAKLAADMVLADSNFATIEVAVEEGRIIYANTKQFIRYLSKVHSCRSSSCIS